MQHRGLEKFIAIILLDKNENFKNYYSFNRVLEWKFKVFPILEFKQELIHEGLIFRESEGVYNITSLGKEFVKDKFDEYKILAFETFDKETEFLNSLFEGYNG
jgi:predicted transcriptional regulator